MTSFKERGFKFLNVIYPIFVTCLLIAGYFTQFGACYSRDHVRELWTGIVVVVLCTILANV